MRDIKFSLYFPKYHFRAGEPTNFVEKIWQAISKGEADKKRAIEEGRLRAGEFQRPFIESFASKDWTPKRTTICAGHRWKEGDFFVPKIWTGIPRRSKPIAICEPLEILTVEPVRIDISGNFIINGYIPSFIVLKEIALDDGFDELDDFELWFKAKKGQTFDGQRIKFA